MNLLNPRYWFQKRTGAFAAAGTEQMNRMRYNALFALDPNVLVRHLVAFNAGDIAGLEHVLEEFENREDKMKIGAFKMSAAVAAKPWEVRIAKGEEDNERAKLHQEVLTRFWNRVEATDAFCRNRRGGVRLLVKQMMSAQSRVYACHDVTWTVRGDGELEALFTFVPAWMFENRTGELRFIRDPGAYTGEPMKDGEWLVTVGEGVGISAAILAMAKRLSWNDWLLFSEKCGMPVILGNTGAKEDTPAWKNLLQAIANVSPKTGILADLETKLQAVQIGGSSGQTTYRELIDVVDRGISALYRGGDLATVSQAGDSVGSNSQDGESELMDGDGCALISETLHRQIDRHVIRFTCGDFEPLAGIVINPPEEIDDVDRDIKVDQQLGEFGVKLSKKDMLARYGRTEAEDDNDAAIRQQPGAQNLSGKDAAAGMDLAQLASLIYPLKAAGYTIQKQQLEGATGLHLQEVQDPNAETQTDPALANEKQPKDAAILAAFAKDMSPAGKAVAELIKNPTKEAAQDLLARLPDLMSDDLAMAAVIAEAMAKEFGFVPGASRPGDELANEITNPCPKCHRQMSKDGTCSFCAKRAANHTAGKTAFEEVSKTHKDKIGAMERDTIGKIDFIWGDDTEGICHILGKHKTSAQQIPGVLAYGDVYESKAENKFYVIKKRYVAVLRKRTGSNHYLITGFKAESPDYAAKIRKECTLVEDGE